MAWLTPLRVSGNPVNNFVDLFLKRQPFQQFNLSRFVQPDLELEPKWTPAKIISTPQ